MSTAFTSFGEFKRRYPIRPNDGGTLLGSGSYGRVVRVEDQVETEWVAIKISEFKGNDTKSLRAEVELAQRVPRQANIARYDACYRLETDTSVSDFAIMKYYPDGNLADLLRRESLNPAQIYDITRGILLGLQHLHRHRIVHRDFKPANILISRDNAGRFIPKIADFGLSKLVSNDELDSSDFDLSDGRGTPSYKAPEQIEGSRVSFNLDLWAFGVILYELLTGEKPFRVDKRNNSEQSARREIEKKIVSVELPARLGQVEEPYGSMIRRCLVRDIHERVRKEDELLDLLDRIPALLTEAQTLFDRQAYDEAIGVCEQILAKREHHTEAQRGIAACKAAIEKLFITNLLREADSLLARQQFEQAERRYEQVLRLAPANVAAINGQARCIEQLLPKPPAVATEPELTDVYEEEKTDVYVTPPAPIVSATIAEQPPVVKEVVITKEPVVRKEPVVAKKTAAKPARSDKAFPKSATRPPVAKPPGRAFPWRIAAPVATALGGLLLYVSLNGTSEPTGGNGKTSDSISTATIVPLVGPKLGDSSESTVPTLSPADAKAAINRRIDVALGKARRAYGQKNYDEAIVLTTSALGLDATRQDVAALRNAAVEARQKAGIAGPVPVPTPGTDVAQINSPASEPEQPKAAEPDPKEAAAAAKKESQAQYDQLIDDGNKAIANGNNKAKAIEMFNKAQALANEHGLNTEKGDAAFGTYLSKAHKIFDTDAFEGAKSWYQVAQSLKDTPEVRRKIKQCSNLNP